MLSVICVKHIGTTQGYMQTLPDVMPSYINHHHSPLVQQKTCTYLAVKAAYALTHRKQPVCGNISRCFTLHITENRLPSAGPVFHDRGNRCYQAGLCSQTLPTNDAWESVGTPLRRLPDAPVKHQCQM